MTTSHRSELDERYQRTIQTSIFRHWRAHLIEGIVFVALGLGAVIAPVVATLAVALYIGIVLIAAGAAGLISTLWMRRTPGFWWSLLLGVLAIAAGVLMLASPVSGVISLTLLLTIFFIIQGVATIVFALEHRRGPVGRWTWMMLSGVIDLLLAAIIIAGLPGTAAWVLGLLVGINLAFAGAALIGIALDARSKLATAQDATAKSPARP